MSSRKIDNNNKKAEKQGLSEKKKSHENFENGKKKDKSPKLDKDTENKTEKKTSKPDKDKKVKSEKKKNRSIAFQLIGERLLARFFSYIFFDIAYIVLSCGAFACYAQSKVNGSVEQFQEMNLSFTGEPESLGELAESLQLVVYNSDNIPIKFDVSGYAEFIYAALCLIILAQLILFFISCISVPLKINRKLKPLYTMTEATMALRNVDLTGDEFSTLQDAINKFSPNNPELKIHTGKKELLGMEDAVNDLLERTRNSYKSQIRFVSDAAHELRTPIAVIQGYANMLDRWGREDKEILDESIVSIKSEAENMNRLVENLLFLARGDSGRTVLRFESISINQLLCDIYDEFVMIDKEHEYRLDLRDDVSAEVDVSLIKQCLRILVDNAIKYSPSGTDIILRLKKRDESSFSIDVQDFGMGIKSEDADKIFERFYRSDPARTRQNGGCGLGLSIAKWIADKHRGYFEVLSYENLGTRISLVLPFEADNRATDTQSDTVEKTKSEYRACE